MFPCYDLLRIYSQKVLCLIMLWFSYILLYLVSYYFRSFPYYRVSIVFYVFLVVFSICTAPNIHVIYWSTFDTLIRSIAYTRTKHKYSAQIDGVRAPIDHTHTHTHPHRTFDYSLRSRIRCASPIHKLTIFVGRLFLVQRLHAPVRSGGVVFSSYTLCGPLLWRRMAVRVRKN